MLATALVWGAWWLVNAWSAGGSRGKWRNGGSLQPRTLTRAGRAPGMAKPRFRFDAEDSDCMCLARPTGIKDMKDKRNAGFGRRDAKCGGEVHDCHCIVYRNYSSLGITLSRAPIHSTRLYKTPKKLIHPVASKSILPMQNPSSPSSHLKTSHRIIIPPTIIPQNAPRAT
jgi:hypothetical protein